MSTEDTVLRFIDCINAHDVERLAALLTPDHRFIDSLGSVVLSRDAVCEGWRQYFQMVPDYRIDINRSLTDQDHMVLLGSASGTYSRRGDVSAEDAWITPAAWHAIVRDALIAEWQVYADNEPIRQRMRSHT
jgi:ketosteroid isomerase-like protein